MGRTGTDPELKLRRLLWRAGLRGYRLNIATLPGKPDIVYTRSLVAVFVDGAFWHGHPSKFLEAKMSVYWQTKIRRNRARDARNSKELRSLGFQVLRVWDFDIGQRGGVVVERIKRAVRRQKAETGGRAVQRRQASLGASAQSHRSR